MAAAAIGLAMGAAAALGQYSGTHTIMPSGGDFSSHAEAADSLMAYGVVGPCTLLMHAGTYAGTAWFGMPSWDSVEVMFLAAPGENVVVEYSGTPWYIYYTDNTTVDGISTVVTDNSYYPYYIYYSHNTTVRNQDIRGRSGAYVFRSPSTTFENCDIKATGNRGLDCSRSDSLRVVGCRIKADSGMGLYLLRSGCRYIVGNHITNGINYGIYAYLDASGSYSYYDTIAVNMINGASSGMYYRYHYCSYLYGNTICGRNYAVHDNYGYHPTYHNNIFVSGSSYPFYKTEGNAPAGSDYNCFCGAGPYVAYYNGSQTLASWRGLGYDSSGMHADPLVGGPTNLHLTPNSPCIDSGMAHSLWPLDIDGEPIHNGVRDIGADEWVGTGVAEGMGNPLVVDLFRPVHIRQQVPMTTVVRGTLVWSASTPSLYGVGGVGCHGGANLLDASGRVAISLQPGPNDVRHIAPGVYFVRDEKGSPPRKVIIQR